MKSRKNTVNRNTKEVNGTKPLLNYLDNPINIVDLLQGETGCDPYIFNLTSSVFSKIKNIHFEYDFEEKNIIVNHNSLFGFMYRVIDNCLKQLGKIDPKRVEDLVMFNLPNFLLFFEPLNITDEEEKWVDTFIKETKDDSDSVTLNIPANNKKYYLINLKRVLEKNRDNPEFGGSIIDFLKSMLQ